MRRNLEGHSCHSLTLCQSSAPLPSVSSPTHLVVPPSVNGAASVAFPGSGLFTSSPAPPRTPNKLDACRPRCVCVWRKPNNQNGKDLGFHFFYFIFFRQTQPLTVLFVPMTFSFYAMLRFSSSPRLRLESVVFLFKHSTSAVRPTPF